MDVKIISNRRGSVIVEWKEDDRFFRGIVPEGIIRDDNTISDALMNLVVPYGVDWDMLLEDKIPEVTPEMFGKELNRVGVWSYDDLVGNPTKAIAAISNIYGVIYSTLVRLAKEAENG